MKYQISSRDYELISAYLDDQLSEKDRALFETRLKTDTELRKELHEISKTRQLIHNLPRLRAPRNYYLKSEALPVRPTLRLAPVFGIVSAVASVLLALAIFGSTFLKTGQPVAMAPALPVVQETSTVQEEVQRGATSVAPATEAPPVMMMSAPAQETPTATNTGVLKTGETEVPTPTTIYIYEYPPTSTPESLMMMSQEQQEIIRKQCEEYYSGTEYPVVSLQYPCPTPTPTSTPTPTATSTSSLHLQQVFATTSATPTNTPTMTTTSTATPTETPTATPTPTSSATPSPTPSPTEVPPPIEKALPTGAAALPVETMAPNVAVDTGASSQAGQEQGVSPSSGPNVSFLNYLLLSVEISLAFIAIIAGIVAIVLRVRAGR